MEPRAGLALLQALQHSTSTSLRYMVWGVSEKSCLSENAVQATETLFWVAHNQLTYWSVVHGVTLFAK